MKKLFAAILALGLIVAVSGTASAVDVTLGGSYYVAGVYDNNPSLMENSYSRAYFYQRIRLQPVIKIAEGLTFTARMDVMEQPWGQPGTNAVENRSTSAAAPNTISWERGYVTFATGIGQFDVGYQASGAWGTQWADTESTKARIKYATKAGPLTLIAILEQNYEGNVGRTYAPDNSNAMSADKDATAYYLAPLYSFKGGIAGVLYGYINGMNQRAYALGSNRNVRQILYPFFKATFGPVYVEAEVNYIFGKEREIDYPNSGKPDIDYQGWGAYLMAKTNLGPATIGAQVGWSKGDGDPTDGTNHTGPGKGADWNPALILLNDDLNTWSGGDYNTNAGSAAGSSNLAGGYLILNAFLNYKVTPKASIGAAFTYATLDEKMVARQVSKDLGYEIDVTATYKIYDNLTYMVGAGYLFTGDAFKGAYTNAKTNNDYILMNKLTLSF